MSTERILSDRILQVSERISDLAGWGWVKRQFFLSQKTESCIFIEVVSECFYMMKDQNGQNGRELGKDDTFSNTISKIFFCIARVSVSDFSPTLGKTEAHFGIGFAGLGAGEDSSKHWVSVAKFESLSL